MTAGHAIPTATGKCLPSGGWAGGRGCRRHLLEVTGAEGASSPDHRGRVAVACLVLPLPALSQGSRLGRPRLHRRAASWGGRFLRAAVDWKGLCLPSLTGPRPSDQVCQVGGAGGRSGRGTALWLPEAARDPTAWRWQPCAGPVPASGLREGQWAEGAFSWAPPGGRRFLSTSAVVGALGPAGQLGGPWAEWLPVTKCVPELQLSSRWPRPSGPALWGVGGPQ